MPADLTSAPNANSVVPPPAARRPPAAHLMFTAISSTPLLRSTARITPGAPPQLGSLQGPPRRARRRSSGAGGAPAARHEPQRAAVPGPAGQGRAAARFPVRQRPRSLTARGRRAPRPPPPPPHCRARRSGAIHPSQPACRPAASPPAAAAAAAAQGRCAAGQGGRPLHGAAE